MPRRTNEQNDSDDGRTDGASTSPGTGAGKCGPARVLILTTAHARWDVLTPLIASCSGVVTEARDRERALELVKRGGFDAALVDAEFAGGGVEIIPELTAAQSSLSCVVVTSEPSVETAVAAMRAGALNLIRAAESPRNVVEAIALAAERTRALREREVRERKRVRKLRSVCRDVSRTRDELMRQMGDLCAGMADTCSDLSDQMRHVALASELNAILRQELELESLLRTVLEYVLKKIGPTNAAVFLPSSTGDYSLGAYINYDCPRDTAEAMLDHLTDVIAPAFEHKDGVTMLRTEAEVGAAFGEGAHWLSDSTAAVFSCRQDGECLAVVALFRDRRHPFTESVSPMLRIIGDLFGRQLARVIKTHHRHLPKDKWGGPGDPHRGPDDIDLAA